MATVDYSRLRNHTLGSGQDEEAVTVNTRALIDKVLARYSGEWTTLRELIQNAADASATSVTIKFETLPSASVPLPQTNDQSAHLKHTVLHHTLRRLLVTNNGQAFGENDWSRLKRIAEGNPDETKIGAFGVGFYSVFAECESPFVTSGDQSMAFFWKGNSLYTRRGALPADMSTKDTSFVLDYRNNTTAVPNLMSICQFLSSSLTFVGLENIDLWLDKWKVFSLRKKAAPSIAVQIPKDVETKTKDGMMRITGVESQNAQIDAVWTNIVGWTPVADSTFGRTTDIDARSQSAPSLRAFFSRMTGSAQANAATKRAAKEEEAAQQAIAEDITGSSQATVFIRIHTVSVKSQVAGAFAAELERATKKPPPKTTRIAILTSSFDETEASLSTLQGAASKKVADVVLSALPTKSGRIFIGFPTAQTTGLLAHISAPSLIPTVERESIDLNARYVRTWNQELLNVAGIACRIAYAGAMSSLRDRLGAGLRATNVPLSDSEMTQTRPAASHILKQFTFREATPLAKAGSIIEEAFWTCNKKATIDMLSSCGVLPSHDIRIASEDLSFVNGLPVVPDELMKNAKDFTTKLLEFGLLSEITTADIKKELERQALTEAQLVEFLKWAAKKTKNDQLDETTIRALFSATIVNYRPEGAAAAQNTLLEVRNIKTFVNVSRISPELPTPPHSIPFRFTKGLSVPDLQSFGWEELQTVPWLRWLVESAISKNIAKESNLLESPVFSAQVMASVSKNWEGLSQSSKSTVVELLSPQAVIPTRLGMRKPLDSYFASVRLFDDLPVVTSLNSVKEKFLKALGVRKTIELAVIFDRLMRADVQGDNKQTWSHVDLVKYLVSVWNDIPDQDIKQLRATALCPAELPENKTQSTSQRYKVSDLFEPKESLRALGLPILHWPGQYNAYGPEGKFLKLLDLRSYPSALELVQIIAKAHVSSETARFELGLKYFLEHHYAHNYAATELSSVQVPFLPLAATEKQKVVKPADCFSNPEASAFGYHILRKDLQREAVKLGVQENPPMFDCALRLMREPPQDKSAAKALFGYFAGRLADVSPNIADRLGSAAIVPVRIRGDGQSGSEKASSVRHTTPNACFLGDDEEFREIFDYVDFGKDANLFLLKVGSKHEPSITELTRLLIREPARILQTLKVDKYKGLLRKIHLNMTMLKKDKTLWKDMRRSPFLLAYLQRPANPTGERKMSQQLDGDDQEDDPMVEELRLRRADQIVVVDDFLGYSRFKQYLTICPQEEALEELYLSMGAPQISSLIEEEPRFGPRRTDQRAATQLKELVLERAQLFLHEQSLQAVVHDAKWLEKHFEVQTVQSVSLRRTLRGYNQSHFETRTAAMTPDTTTTRSSRMLSITVDYDMWQVSQEIVNLIMSHPKTQIIMVFETFLRTSLHKLRARGYNVDRVLRRKAAEEARMAEIDRQRHQEEEAQKARDMLNPKPLLPAAPEGVNDHGADNVEGGQLDDTKALVPGAFHDSPDRPKLQDRTKSKGLFSSLTRHLGFDDNSTASQSLQNLLGNNVDNTPREPKAIAPEPFDPSKPPPYTDYDPNALSNGGTRGPKPEPVSHPNNTQQNLQRAINACRSHQSSTLFNRPSTTEVKETTSYCDSRPGTNLRLVSTTGPGLQMYIDPTSSSGVDPTTFVASHTTALNTFSNLLLSCSAVFNLPPKTIHLFYDTTGSTIAFNSNGSIFANFRFFAQLHLPGLNTTDPGARAQANAQALVYWWVVLCHELAHNLVSDHSADHSYYTEHFVVQYFPAVAGRLVSSARADALGLENGFAAGSGVNGVERAFS